MDNSMSDWSNGAHYFTHVWLCDGKGSWICQRVTVLRATPPLFHYDHDSEIADQ